MAGGQARANWLCFAELAPTPPVPRATSRPGKSGLGLFGQPASRRSAPEIGFALYRCRGALCSHNQFPHQQLSFIGPVPRLALFVQPARAGPRRQTAARVPPNWVCLYNTGTPPSPSRVPPGPGHPAGNWVCFAYHTSNFAPQTGSNWVCLTPTTKVPKSAFDPRFWADIEDRFGRSRLLSWASCLYNRLPAADRRLLPFGFLMSLPSAFKS
jgi:hypothetical protein